MTHYSESFQEVYRRCLNVLTRREHSQYELRHKMQTHGYDKETIEAVLCKLIDDGYQSDDRFIEVFCRSRVNKKHGPKKIAYDFSKKGIDSDMVEPVIREYYDNFLDHAIILIERKIPAENCKEFLADFKNKQKIIRSLSQKGYDFDMIRLAIDTVQEQNQ